MSIDGEKGVAMPMRLTSMTAAALAIGAILGLASTVACSKAAGLRAMLRFKEANRAYQTRDYAKSVELYEETVQANPDLVQVYFFLGNSYDNLYKPGVEGPDNAELLVNAIKNYELAADKLATDVPEELGLKKLALQYLAAAYGADKLDDPGKAEPVIQRMIRLDPGDPTNYFALAKLYEDAGVYEEAEQILVMAKAAKPSDPAVYMTLAGYYNRQGDFDKTMDALEERAGMEPNNPEAFHTIASYYWDEANSDVRLQDVEKKDFVLKGLTAADRALQISPDYVEAVVFKGLLLRLQANLENDVETQQDLIEEATQLQTRAEDLRKRRTTGL